MLTSFYDIAVIIFVWQKIEQHDGINSVHDWTAVREEIWGSEFLSSNHVAEAKEMMLEVIIRIFFQLR